MAKQRYISTSIWDDDWFVEELSHEEQLFYFYLLTNEHTNIAGIYKLSIRKIAQEAGFTSKEVKAMFATFEESKKVFYMDDYVIMPNWVKHQNWEKSKKIHKGIRAILIKEVPSSIIQAISYGIIPYQYPIHTLSEGIDSLPEGYTYPSNYLDSDSDLDSDFDSTFISKDIAQSDDSLSAGEEVKDPIFILPQLGGKEFPITQDQVETFSAAYPAVNVPGELHKMKAWLMANKKNQKKDVMRFANSWLSRAQDDSVKPSRSDRASPTKPSQRTLGNDDRWDEYLAKQEGKHAGSQ